MKLLRIMGTALLFLATQSSHLMGMDKKTIEHNLMILHAHSKKDALKRTAGDVAKTEEALKTLQPAADAGSLSTAQQKLYDRVLGQVEDDKKRLGMTTVTMRTDGTLPEEMSPRRAALLAKRGITVTGQPKVTTPVVKPGMTKPEVNAQVNVTGMSPRRAALLAKRGISITGTPLTVPAVVIPGTQVTRGTQVANNEMIEALIKDKIENKLTQFFVGNQVKSAEVIKVFGDLRRLQRQGSSYTDNVIVSLIGKAIDTNKNPFIKEDMKRNLEEEFRRMFFEAPALPPRPEAPAVSTQTLLNTMLDDEIAQRFGGNLRSDFYVNGKLDSEELGRVIGDIVRLGEEGNISGKDMYQRIMKTVRENESEPKLSVKQQVDLLNIVNYAITEALNKPVEQPSQKEPMLQGSELIKAQLREQGITAKEALNRSIVSWFEGDLNNFYSGSLLTGRNLNNDEVMKAFQDINKYQGLAAVSNDIVIYRITNTIRDNEESGLSDAQKEKLIEKIKDIFQLM